MEKENYQVWVAEVKKGENNSPTQEALQKMSEKSLRMRLNFLKNMEEEYKNAQELEKESEAKSNYIQVINNLKHKISQTQTILDEHEKMQDEKNKRNEFLTSLKRMFRKKA